jgi:hypothetical protein
VAVVESLADSFLIFGRASLGATIGLAIGWRSQGERHVFWVIGWVLVGYLAGMIAMEPHWGSMTTTALFLVPCTVGYIAGLAGGAYTLGDREDWWLRLWGWGGFLVTFHILAYLVALSMNVAD